MQLQDYTNEDLVHVIDWRRKKWCQRLCKLGLIYYIKRSTYCNYQIASNYSLMSRPITLLLLASLIPQSTCFLGLGRLQSVAVKGVLECNGAPAKDVKVRLYDKQIFFDKRLDEGRTLTSGSFYLSGSKREITNIDPRLYIYHSCNLHGPCSRKVVMTIPDSFITSGRNPQKVFNIGRVNLAAKTRGESITCLH
ncbi:unnamed protein product [Cylicocyclus nassatus]|uniref:Transthyretin-like family protein n=1 Tax=Cylicocyclus nassatus TaxID=53992 RepID=A0AA36M1A0_CYLNA|nr:unnamed protein product [Cylicocyclus nassatus]